VANKAASRKKKNKLIIDKEIKIDKETPLPNRWTDCSIVKSTSLSNKPYSSGRDHMIL
jgi:hypothetical protein